MKNNSAYYHNSNTKICKDIYRPSTNMGRFFKSILSIIMVGKSPISNNTYTRRKP